MDELKEAGGYIEGIFLEKDIIKDLQCPICLDVIRDCVETPCGHLFCEACIKDFLSQRSKEDQLCPMDQIPIDRDHLTPVISNRRKILSAKVMCQNQYQRQKQKELENDGEENPEGAPVEVKKETDELNCPWVGTLNKLQEHLLVCNLRMVTCPYAQHGCQVEIELNPRTLEKHLNDNEVTTLHLKLLTTAYTNLEEKFLSLQNEYLIDSTDERPEASRLYINFYDKIDEN